PPGPENPLPAESAGRRPRGGVEHTVGRPEVPDLGPRLAGDGVPRGPEVPDRRRRRQSQVVEVAVPVAGDLVARLDDAACCIRRAADLLADDEEGGLPLEFSERRGGAGDGTGRRAVVEGQPDTPRASAPAVAPVDPAGRPED